MMRLKEWSAYMAVGIAAATVAVCLLWGAGSVHGQQEDRRVL